MLNMKYFPIFVIFLLTSCSKTEIEAPTKLVHDISFGDELHHSDPTIALEILGRNTKMVLDTGSSQIFLMEKFVNTLPQFANTTKSVIPASFENLVVNVGASTFRSKDNLVIPDINGFFENGLAGIISPQSLALQGDGLIIDFPNKKLIELSASTAGLDEQLIRLYPNIKFKKFEWVGRDEGMMLIKTSLNGKAHVLTDLDTGSPYTSYCAEYAGQIETEPGISSYGADNKKIETMRTKESQMIELSAGNPTWGKITILPSQEEGATDRWCGSLGMDVLKDFVIVISPKVNDYVFLGRAESK
jgi:hypothetical protein